MVMSLALNVVFVTVGAAHVVRRGGVRYVKQKLGLAHHEFRPRQFQQERLNYFRVMPNGPDDVIFAGDSHMAGAPFAEAYTNITNRGIGGDTTSGLLARLDEITEGKPERVFLCIGGNDVANFVPEKETVENFREILRRIRRDSPATRIFMLAIPPITRESRDRATNRNPRIHSLNKHAEALASEFGATFIPLDPKFLDAEGCLKKEYAMQDGTHLNDIGRLELCELLRPFVPAHGDAVDARAATAGGNGSDASH